MVSPPRRPKAMSHVRLWIAALRQRRKTLEKRIRKSGSDPGEWPTGTERVDGTRIDMTLE
jgi:hypothetical protein